MPHKRTPARKRALIAALRKGHGYASAAHACDLAPSIFRDWRATDPVFRAECEAATDFAGDVAEHVLYQRGISGQSDLCLLAWLRAHRPHLYHRKMLVALGGDPDNPLTINANAMIYPRPELARDPVSAFETAADDPVSLAEATVDGADDGIESEAA